MKRILVLLVTILTITGCTEDTPPTMYTLSVTSNPTEGGTINPTNGEYEEGTEVTITVTPNLNYEFDKWSGNWSGSESPLTLTMDSDKNIVGNFKLMDSDGDGVTDDIDTCPDTPNGEQVDDYGCPINNSVGILYGYEGNEKSLYEVDKNDGSLTKVIELNHNVDWNLVYDNSTNQIIGSSEQNSGGGMVSLIVIDLNSNSVTYPEFQYTSSGQRITDLVSGKDGILYGYEGNEKSLYEVDKNDGSLTKVIELNHNVDWNLVYDNSTNQIIGSSEQNSGGGMVSLIVIDLNSNSVTYPEFQYTSSGQRITDLVSGKDGILYGYEGNEKSLYEVDKNDGSLTKVIELNHNVDWNLVYDNSTNQIIGSSEQNSGGGMVSLIVIDLNSNSVTYPEFQYTSSGQRITDLVIGNK